MWKKKKKLQSSIAAHQPNRTHSNRKNFVYFLFLIFAVYRNGAQKHWKENKLIWILLKMYKITIIYYKHLWKMIIYTIFGFGSKVPYPFLSLCLLLFVSFRSFLISFFLLLFIQCVRVYCVCVVSGCGYVYFALVGCSVCCCCTWRRPRRWNHLP